MSIESVMPSNRLILCRPLLLLPSIFPSIRVFSNESALCIRWPNYWRFSFSISPSHEYSGLTSFRWLLSTHRRVSLPLGATGAALKAGSCPEESTLPPSLSRITLCQGIHPECHEMTTSQSNSIGSKVLQAFLVLAFLQW